MILKYIICLQRGYYTNSYLLGICFHFFVIMHKADFLIHKSLWASVIISLEKYSRDEIVMSNNMGIFKALDIYYQLALRKGHANLFFLQNSIFYFHEDDRAILGG